MLPKVTIEKGARQKVIGVQKEDLSVLKDFLTFPNPKYAQAKRYSRYGYTTIPPYLTYYTIYKENGHTVIEVPIGVDVPKILGGKYRYSILNYVCDEVCYYPPIQIELRKDQQKAFNAYVGNNTKNGIIQMPTGKGKSILGIYTAFSLRMKTLVLVHKDDLVVGWKEDINLCFGGKVKPGLIKAKSRKVGDQITIATVQTLSRMSEEEFARYSSQFSLVILDECHHVGANTFNIIDRFNSEYKMGLSATPTRSDGLTHVFDLFFGGIIYKHKYTKEDKDILPVKVKVMNSRAKFLPFVETKGNWMSDQIFNYYDFKKQELPSSFSLLEDIPYSDRPTVPFSTTDTSIVTNTRFKIQVCKDILFHARKGHSVIALFTQKEHIDLYYSYLKRYIDSDKIMKYYGDSKESSKDMMKKAESREVLITLATLAKATEGTNVKAWEVLFLVSSINNKKNVEQATGRIRRTQEGKLNPVLVYDYYQKDCYSVRSHINTRMDVYRKLKYTVECESGELLLPKNKDRFSRGYKKVF